MKLFFIREPDKTTKRIFPHPMRIGTREEIREVPVPNTDYYRKETVWVALLETAHEMHGYPLRYGHTYWAEEMEADGLTEADAISNVLSKWADK